MKVKVYNLIIVDESGSMSAIHKAAVDGLNETLQTIQGAQKSHGELQEHLVTMVFFNSNETRVVIENQPIDRVKLLKRDDFSPTACTPLFDAMGSSLSKLRYQVDHEEKHQVLVTIITDGEENASTEYNRKMIKKLVNDLKEQGWVFAYIGANQDVHEVARSMDIDNFYLYDACDEGSRAMSTKVNRSRSRFFDRLSRSVRDSSVDLMNGFFEEDEN
ncbi:VWA domain-containing protein [Parabacteroides sp. OttesenSCG-928-N08]|nr:VWA domain-containing protein [Parabacteroides sp. OttesenSCG-928-N08]